MIRSGATFINRDYTRLWAGQAVSSVGDTVFDTTLVLWISTRIGHGRSWAPAAVSGLTLAMSVATLSVGLVAGVLVDRWNRRRTMLRTELVRGALVGVLAALSFLPRTALPTAVWLVLIYTIVTAVTCMGLLFNPARFATIRDLVEDQADRARAAGIGQATSSAAVIIGPPLAAPLFFTIGFQWALVFNALSYFWSWAAIRSIRKPDTFEGGTGAGSSIRQEMVDGLRYAATNRFLRAMLVVVVIASFGTGPLNALGVFFTTENLHTRDSMFGVLSMGIGAGSILGALCAGRFVQRLGARLTTCAALVVTGATFLLYARQTEFAVGLALFAVCGFFVTMLNTSITPLLMATTPNRYLGRVVSLLAPFVELAQLLSVMVAGWLASTVLVGYHGSVAGLHMGRIDIVFSFCGLLILLAGLYAFRGLPPDAAPEPASAGDDDRGQHQPVGHQEPAVDPA
jgi:MFS family permease